MCKVVLNALIGGYNLNLIPHFIQHYKDSGVEEFNIVVNLIEDRYKDLDKVLSFLRKFNIKPLYVFIGPYLGRTIGGDTLKKVFQGCILRECKETDWIVRADLDEFIMFEKGVKDLVRKCKEGGYSYVEGRRVERISPEGNLPEIKEESDVFKLFPIKASIKEGFCFPLRNNNKICLAKKQVKVPGAGFHRVENDPLSESKYPEELEINHFRWSKDIIESWEKKILYKKRFKRKKGNLGQGRRNKIENLFKDRKSINMEMFDIYESVEQKDCEI